MDVVFHRLSPPARCVRYAASREVDCIGVCSSALDVLANKVVVHVHTPRWISGLHGLGSVISSSRRVYRYSSSPHRRREVQLPNKNIHGHSVVTYTVGQRQIQGVWRLVHFPRTACSKQRRGESALNRQQGENGDRELNWFSHPDKRCMFLIRDSIL